MRRGFLTLGAIFTAAVSLSWPSQAEEPGSQPTLAVTVDELVRVEKEVLAQVEAARAAVVVVRGDQLLGSGVLLSSGEIATAAHVVNADGGHQDIIFADGTTVPAELIGLNEGSDVALLKVSPDAEEKPPAGTVEVRPLREPPVLGEWVFSLGHPAEYDAKRGSVLRIGRIVRIAADTVQTDCVLLGGDSGGPLFDLKGRLIGVNSRISTSGEQNFHATSAALLRDWKELLAGRKLNRPSAVPWTGVRWEDQDGGLFVAEVAPGGPAEQSGVRAGDQLVEIDGERIGLHAEVTSLLRLRLIGETMRWKVLRAGKEQPFDVTGGTR